MHDRAYIERQPIVDRQQKIVGYELLFKGHADAASAERSGAAILAADLNAMSEEWSLGDKLVFLDAGNAVPEGELPDALPAKRIVLQIPATQEPDEELLKGYRDLRAKGFSLAVLDFEPGSHADTLLELAHFVMLDTRHLDAAQLAETAASLQDHSLHLIAKGIETNGEFKTCRDMGFHYFQGFYFTHPESMAAKVINPAHSNVLNLLNQVRGNADVKQIEVAFKRDVALSFKLLRYINSVGFGLSCEIQSIRHAVAILGYPQLYRWLTLLLVTAGGESVSPALTKTAVTRGRLTELLGQDYLEQADRDNLFIVGVFSLLDAMLEMPMERVLEKLALPESICDALLSRQGIYGPFLDLAEACEAPETGRIDELAAQLQLEPETVNRAHLAALAWVEKVGI